MSCLNYHLDADWARLNYLSKAPVSSRRVWHSFSSRFAPVTLVRIAMWLELSGWSRLAKIPALLNFVVFGIEVPPRAKIGPGLVLMHTQGTVLGAASIGSNVTIYHQVTLGAKDIDFSYTTTRRPCVGDNVVIGAGAKVLGGIMLGNGCVIGANAVVLENVPAEHIAVGIPAKNLPQNKSLGASSVITGKHG